MSRGEQKVRDRQVTAALIREYLQKKYGTAAVQMSSDGMERIYYNGVSLLDLADALSDPSTGRSTGSKELRFSEQAWDSGTEHSGHFAGPSMTKQQEDLIYRAYLGICSLKRCEAKWGTDLQVARSTALLKAMGEAFPFIPERVALSALRGSRTPQASESAK